MMNIEKGRFSVTKEALSLEVGLTKVNQATRTVSGFATIDNVDLQGDVVEFDASIRAFERSRKNVREMHQPIAVGKIVSYEPKEYLDVESGKLYKGVYVSVYVSKGAEDTWQKVLDGTLSAFSIKGPVRKMINEHRPGHDQPIRVVKDYDLEELSLVDSGGNQWANVISIQKDAAGDTTGVSGIAMDVETENVFWCKKDKVSITSGDSAETCPDGHDMALIGWIESGDTDSVQKIKDMVGRLEGASDEREIEGGVQVMAEEVNKSEEATEQVTPEAEVEETKVEATEPEAEAVSTDSEKEEEVVSEVPDEGDEIAKIYEVVEGLEKRIDEGLENNRSAIDEAIERIEKSITASLETNETKINDFEKRQEDVKKALDDISGRFDAVSKSVEALDGSSALKKSNDLGGSEVAGGEESSGLWKNSIL